MKPAPGLKKPQSVEVLHIGISLFLPVSVTLSAMRTPVKKGPVKHPELLRIVSSPFGAGLGNAMRGGPRASFVSMQLQAESVIYLTRTASDSLVDVSGSSSWRLIDSTNSSESDVVADGIGLGINSVVELTWNEM